MTSIWNNEELYILANESKAAEACLKIVIFAGMKIMAFILLLFFVASSPAVNQLLKCRILIDHYIEHRERNQQVTFLDFMAMHYWGEDINDSDNDRDKQLPFKSVDANSYNSQYFIGFKAISVKVESNAISSIHFPLRKCDYFPNPNPTSLLKPPRG